MSNDQAAEQELLASLNASVQEQHVYEDAVIREATQQLAPLLNKDTLGFPSLQSLAPSYDSKHPERFNASDTSIVHDALTRTRRDIAGRRLQPRTMSNGKDQFSMSSESMSTVEQQRQVDRLMLKEQLLLSLLINVAGEPLGNLLSTGSSDERVRRERIPQSLQREGKHKHIVDPKCQRQLSASDGRHDHGRARIGMMQRKEMMRKAVIDDDEDERPNDGLTPEQREHLLQIRLERQERRQRRKRISVEEVMDSSSSEEEEFDETEDDSPVSTRGSNAKVDSHPLHRTSSPSLPTSTECPVCHKTVPVDDPSQIDSILSHHIAQCKQGRPMRRSKRGDVSTPIPEPSANSVTKRRAAAKNIFIKKRRTVETATMKAVDDLEELNYEDRVDDWIENGLHRMKKMKERDTEDSSPGAQYMDGLYIPAWVNDRLFGYQREGIRWMWDLHQQRVGGVVGDEMGLGKTVQVSAFLGMPAGSRKLKSVLLIVPATMLQHWLNELAVWAPGLRRILVHQSGESDGTSRSISPKMLDMLAKWLKRCRADRLYEAIDASDQQSMEPHSFCGTGYAVITTYENLRRNPDLYENHSWSYVVLDEAQRIRNPEAEITLACKRIRTPHRLALSGTPIQNDLRELWSIFDFVYPGRLGLLPTFEQEFADPIKRGGYSNASPVQVQLAYRCSLVLKDLINPYLLRRQKKDVKEVKRMPGKTEHVLFCRLSGLQRSMYKAYLASDEVRRVLRGSNHLFAAVTMLRKICNHPDLVCSPDQASIDSFLQNGFVRDENHDDEMDEDEDYLDDMKNAFETSAERSGKLEVLSKILPLWHQQGHRVLIFCQWVKMLNIIEKFTSTQGWKFGRIDGKTSVAARQRLVDSFNSNSSYYGLLCTTQTGGIGLNLTGADRVVLFDPSWNPQTDAQARERAWRFGQEREVTVYRLITAGTIEEKIYHRQIFKTSLSNKILQDPRQRRLFSQRDLRDLFTLKEDTGSVRGGSDGITETGAITKGSGVIDPDEECSEETLKDDQATLEHVMKSKGLAGVFDHNFVEQDCRQKSTSVREMEERAKQVAREAARALQSSIRDSEPFVDSRFGVGRINGMGVIGSGKKQASTNSSTGLLTSLRQRREAVSTEGESKTPSDEAKEYAKLLKRIEVFVRGRCPSTDDIMTEFADVTSSKDVAVFRNLLKSVADVHRGKWYLK